MNGEIIPFDRTRQDNSLSQADYEAEMAEFCADPNAMADLNKYNSPFEVVK